SDDPTLLPVWVLSRTDGKRPTNQSFHARESCGTLQQAVRNAEANDQSRVVEQMTMRDAVALPATQDWGTDYGSLQPCTSCWPMPFKGIAGQGKTPQQVLDAARMYLASTG
ncbi:MAG TPA: hypothetical protein VFG74_02235, partial [Miltoncostaeaceae bacterium]|nr:hypothetical protein [Miltoncostaeaceae bacterium]